MLMGKDSYAVKGKIWTGDHAFPYADWFRVKDGLIVGRGDKGAFTPSDGEKVYDYGGIPVLPGFTDAHIHFTAFAKRKLYRDLSAARYPI